MKSTGQKNRQREMPICPKTKKENPIQKTPQDKEKSGGGGKCKLMMGVIRYPCQKTITHHPKKKPIKPECVYFQSQTCAKKFAMLTFLFFISIIHG
jgi:hypothetical protein